MYKKKLDDVKAFAKEANFYKWPEGTSARQQKHNSIDLRVFRSWTHYPEDAGIKENLDKCCRISTMQAPQVAYSFQSFERNESQVVWILHGVRRGPRACQGGHGTRAGRASGGIPRIERVDMITHVLLYYMRF